MICSWWLYKVAIYTFHPSFSKKVYSKFSKITIANICHAYQKTTKPVDKYMFKANNKEYKKYPWTLLYCLYCWLWTNSYLMFRPVVFRLQNCFHDSSSVFRKPFYRSSHRRCSIKKVFLIIHKIHKKIAVPESLF